MSATSAANDSSSRGLARSATSRDATTSSPSSTAKTSCTDSGETGATVTPVCGTVTTRPSDNAISKVVVGPVFGFLAGLIIDRFGARRLMLAGIVMAGAAVVGLSTITTPGGFYVFYFLNALGYVCGGPLPCQVLLTRWFDDGRGKAMGVAYLGIGVGGALVPILAHALTTAFGWRGALRWLGLLMIAVAFPPAFFVRDRPAPERARELPAADSLRPVLTRPAFWLLAI